MKIGIITDIHNNIVALEAVLAYFEKEQVEHIICCGDMIGIGPYPEETVQRMRKLPHLTAVRGNHERYLLEGLDMSEMEQPEAEHHKWEHARLSDSSVEFLQGLPYKTEIDLCGMHIAVMHYCLDDKNKCVNYRPDADDDDLSRMFAHVDGDIIVYGHDHSRKIAHVRGKQYINVGSLGCPSSEKNIARAGILEIGADIKITPVDIKYNAEKVVDAIDRLNYPAADEIKKIFYGV